MPTDLTILGGRRPCAYFDAKGMHMFVPYTFKGEQRMACHGCGVEA